MSYQVLAGATQTPVATFRTLAEAEKFAARFPYRFPTIFREVDTTSTDAANARVTASAMRKRVY